MSPFHLALEGHNVEVCKFLLEKVPNLVDQPILDATGNYPMHVACKSGNIDMVKFLIGKKSIYTLPNKKGESPIDVAIQFGTSEVVNLLLEKNPRIMKNKDASGRSLLHIAVLFKRTNIVKELLKRGIHVNAQTFKPKSTPLHLACKKVTQSEEIVKLLLEKDASPNTLDKNGYTPLQWAIMSKNTRIVEILVQSKKCDLSIKNKDGKTALDMALEDNQFEISKILSKETQNLLHNSEQSRAKKKSTRK